MEAVKFLKEYKRMCNSYRHCKDCPMAITTLDNQMFFCHAFIRNFPEEAIEIVEKWSKEHLQKTILDDFKEKYPNSKKYPNGFPHVCPKMLGYYISPQNIVCTNCFETQEYIRCWNTPLEEAK